MPDATRSIYQLHNNPIIYICPIIYLFRQNRLNAPFAALSTEEERGGSDAPVVDFLTERPPSAATKKMMKKCERRARTRNRYGTTRAQKTGWNNAWRVLRQLWYAKFCFGSSPASPYPPRAHVL